MSSQRARGCGHQNAQLVGHCNAQFVRRRAGEFGASKGSPQSNNPHPTRPIWLVGKSVAYTPLQQRPRYRLASMPLRYHQPQPHTCGFGFIVRKSCIDWRRFAVLLHARHRRVGWRPGARRLREVVHREVGCARSARSVENAAEIGCLGDHFKHGAHRTNVGSSAAVLSCLTLDGKAFAALRPACVDDGATAAGLHADQEAMRASATGFRSLIGAFHSGSNKFAHRWRVRRLQIEKMATTVSAAGRPPTHGCRDADLSMPRRFADINQQPSTSARDVTA